MAKILPPPMIQNLDGIVDLLTDPKKYADYLLTLKTMIDTINERLEMLNTKEDADALLSQAKNKMVEAVDMVAAAQQAKTQLEADCARQLSALTAAQDLFERESGRRSAELDRKAASLEEQAMALAARSAHLTEQEADIRTREAMVAADRNALVVAQESFSQKRKALQDAGF